MAAKPGTKFCYINDRTGGIDIVFDPKQSACALRRDVGRLSHAVSLNSGGDKSGLYRSADDGATWKRIEGNGMPEGPLGRIGVGVSGGDSNVVYALIEAKKGGLYRSDDGGLKWALINPDHRFRQRAWYFTHVWADPKNANTVYIANTGLFRSIDGGKAFERVNAPHGDHHGLWIDPRDTNRLINGNDGGATVSVRWRQKLDYPEQSGRPRSSITWLLTNDFLYRVYGSQQDTAMWAIRTRSDHGFIDRGDWDAVGGGESGHIAPDPRDSNIVYADDEGPFLTRFDRTTGQAQSIQQYPDDLSGHPASSQKYRYTWTMPLIVFVAQSGRHLSHFAVCAALGRCGTHVDGNQSGPDAQR